MARSRSVWKTLGALVVALMVAALLLWRQLDASMEQRSHAPDGTRIQVHAGASLRVVLGELAHAHALRNPRLVEWYLRLHREPLRAQAGIYELARGADTRQILEQLRAGRVVLAQVTIVEGWSFAQMRQALDASADLVEARANGRLGRPGTLAPLGFAQTSLFRAPGLRTARAPSARRFRRARADRGGTASATRCALGQRFELGSAQRRAGRL